MQQIFKYIRSFYQKEFNLFYLLLIIILLAFFVYLNYWHGLEKKYASGTTWLSGFFGYYFLYFIPFAAAFFLQLFFLKDCTYFSNKWFWLILFLAPAFFSFRVNFNFHQSLIIQYWDAPENQFWLRSINWVVRVFVLLIPVIIFWWVKDASNQPFYGIKKTTDLQPYLLMVLFMLPLLALAATQKDFQTVYPKAQVLKNIPLRNWQYFVYEICYGADFVSIEFFFRGFLILALANVCGTHSIIPVACFYFSIHLGKPMGEAISSFWGGLLLGIISYHTASVWGGLFVHLGIAWLMELAGWLALVKR